LCGGLDILKVDKNSTNVSIWGLGALFVGAKPTKAPRGDGVELILFGDI